MNRWRSGMGMVVPCLCLLAGSVLADRVPSSKAYSPPNPGTRGDITVPYLTSGYSALMHGAVAPRIYNSPIVDDPKNPGVKPVFNLIFYGAAMQFGDASNGAAQRPPNELRPPPGK
jgi:hypothetical protein